MQNIALKRQDQFFTEYRAIYERDGEVDLDNIGSLSDHHLMAILFQLRWEILVGLERHFVRKPPGPVVATGSTGHYQTKAGSLPIAWNENLEMYESKGTKETLQKNIDQLKKYQSEIRCAVHLPSDYQLANDEFTDEDQKSGIKVELEEFNAQISYELGSIYFLQLKYNDAAQMFKNVRVEIEKHQATNTGTEILKYLIEYQDCVKPTPYAACYGVNSIIY